MSATFTADQLRYDGFLSVKSFGAVGDGVTDDRVAIQTCMAAAAALGGGRIYFPPGTYICSQAGANPYSLDLPGDNLTLYGVKGKSWLKHPTGLPASSVALLRVNQRSHVVIHDLGFDGNWGNATTIITAASNNVALPVGTINVEDTSNFPASGSFSVVLTTGTQVITYTGKTATSFTGCAGGTGTMFWGNTVGYVDSQDGINQTTQGDPKNYLLMIRGANDMQVDNCTFYNAYGDFVWMGFSATDGNKYAQNIRLTNCVGDISARNGFTIGQQVNGIIVQNCRLTSIYSQAFDTEPVIQGSFNVRIEDCYLDTWWNPARNIINSPLSIAGGTSTQPAPGFYARTYRVRGCTIKGCVLIQTAVDVVIENCRIIADFAGSSYAPILIQQFCDDIWILSNYIYDRTSDGSGTGHLHDASIQASVYSSSNYNGQPSGITIRGNTVHSRNGRKGILASATGGGAFGLTTELADASGTATGITTNTLTDAGAAWTVNEWIGFWVRVGTAWAVVSGNSATQLSLAVPEFYASAWTDYLGSAVATPVAPATYLITTARGICEISDNLIECTDDGYGAGSFGIWISAGRAGMRARVSRNRIRNAGTDGININCVTAPDRTMTWCEVSDNKVYDDQLVPTCTSAIRFVNPQLLSRLVLRNTSSGDGVANAVSGLTSGQWLIQDGTVQQWAGYGAPEGVVTAPVGSTFQRVDGVVGSTFYVKQSGTGNTGWAAMSGMLTVIAAGHLDSGTGLFTKQDGFVGAVKNGVGDWTLQYSTALNTDQGIVGLTVQDQGAAATRMNITAQSVDTTHVRVRTFSNGVPSDQHFWITLSAIN